MTRFIDITPPLSGDTPVFPGDTPFALEHTWVIGGDCPVNVSRLKSSTHAGAHADAPLHYDANGASIDAVDVGAYIGPCVLLRVTIGASFISAKDIETALARIGVANPERVLIRTYERQPVSWDEDFAAIGADAIDYLASLSVRLIGVDTPSLDPATSKTLDAHRAVCRADMRILENLKLDDVDVGEYELIAPPLKIAGGDAAPVRAILRMV
ncbi:MAG: arylformamidase [Marinicaulis sp.]|nr:arylformamidase [Marinicaulis sp.]NNL88220.1 arylformamidase [Marinicaulis sp.]